MASEKPKQGDKLANPSSTPQRNEKHGALDLTNSPADHNGILDDRLPPFPFFQTEDMQGMPQHYAQEMPLPAICMMNDFSQFNFSDRTAFDHDYLYGPVPDISLLEENVNEPVDCFPLCALTDVSSKMDDGLQNSKIYREVEGVRSNVARGSEMRREAAEVKISDVHRSSLIGERVASTPMATHSSTRGRGVINNIVNTSATQSSHPQILDGSSLKLGVRSNTEPRSTSNVSSRYRALKYNEAALTQSSALCGQKDDTSSLSSSSKMSGDFSTIRNNAGGFDNKASNDSGFSSLTQNVDGLSRVVRNAGRASQQVQNVVEFSNLLPNIGGFSNQMQSVNGISPQTQNVDAFSSQLQSVEQVPRLSQNEGGRISSLLADRQNNHSFPSSWNSGPRVNMNARFANVNPSTGIQGYPTEPLILHNRNQVGIPDYGHGATGLQSYSFIRNATQSSSDHLQYPHTGTFTNLSPGPSLGVPYVGYARSNIGQRQSGPVIPAANAPAQASSVPCRPSCKRGASESSLATPEALHRKFRVSRASSHLSAPNMAQIASPHAPPPLAWTPFLRPPSFHLARPCIIQSSPDMSQINAPYPALVRIPHLSPPPVQTANRNLAQGALNVAQMTPPPVQTANRNLAQYALNGAQMTPPPVQTANRNLAQYALNGAQMTPPYSPLAWTPPNPVLVQTDHPHLAQFALNLTQAPLNAPLAGTPLSSQLLIQTVRQNFAQKPPIFPLLAQNTSVRPPLSHRVPPLPSAKAPDHIKWQEPEKTPQLSGHQCFICKRDLSFAPEGPVEQPVNPQPVAVLPCHHHFHAFCLERITAGSDAENPPCIPCALGDKN
ncbi:transcription factor C2H2 family [Salix suchowensis]|nr:transcription factor C2H2 family [Salix suchowensis]